MRKVLQAGGSLHFENKKPRVNFRSSIPPSRVFISFAKRESFDRSVRNLLLVRSAVRKSLLFSWSRFSRSLSLSLSQNREMFWLVSVFDTLKTYIERYARLLTHWENPGSKFWSYTNPVNIVKLAELMKNPWVEILVLHYYCETNEKLKT